MPYGLKIESYMKYHQITLEDIKNAIDEKVGIESGDMLFLSGSLTEGLGNYKSDIDAYIITDRDLKALQTGPLIAISCKNCFVDLEWKRPGEIKEALEKLKRWSANQIKDPRESLLISSSDRELLHRLRIGKPLVGNNLFKQFQSEINVRALARISFDQAIAVLGAIQTDIIGLLEEKDFRSAAVRCQDFLGNCIDALLAVLGDTNPGRKWRFRKLERQDQRLNMIRHQLPFGLLTDSLASLFFGLYSAIWQKEEEIIDLALQSVHLANTIVPWGQQVFFEECHINEFEFPQNKNQQRQNHDAVMYRDTHHQGVMGKYKGKTPEEYLPALAMDVRIRRGQEGIELYNQSQNRVFLINQLAYEMLICFNGKITLTDAIGWLSQFSETSEDQLLQAVLEWKDFLFSIGFLSLL